MPLNANSPDCPKCGAWITKVILTKLESEAEHVIRRRHCEYCGHRFYTRQTTEELVNVRWVKADRGRNTIPEVIEVIATPKKKKIADAPRAQKIIRTLAQ